MDRTRERQTFSIRSQTITILAFEGRTVSVKASPICPRRGSDNHRQYVCDWTRLYANKTLIVDTETGGSYNFPVSCQNHSSFDFFGKHWKCKTILSLQAIHRDWACFEHTLANPWFKSPTPQHRNNGIPEGPTGSSGVTLGGTKGLGAKGKEGTVGLASEQRDVSALLHGWGALGGFLCRLKPLNCFWLRGGKETFFIPPSWLLAGQWVALIMVGCCGA